jgi:MtaA/CmuA family methyltransferase
MTSRERIYAILNGRPYDRPAVTPIFMSWAARYIGRSYRDFYLDGDVLAEAQLAVTGAFNVDQVSAISDPWREASAYGVEFDYPPDGVGKPKNRIIETYDDISRLRLLDLETSPRMKQRIDSIRQMAAKLGKTHSVLGWIEGPLAEYADLRGLENALMDLIDNPEMFTGAADMIIHNALAFAVAQINAGADMIGIGDAAASLIGANLYKKFVLPLEQKLIAEIHNAGAAVKLHICGNIISIIQYMAQTGTDVLDVDWMVPLDKARGLAGPNVTLCGNFDPSAVLLQGTPEDVAAAARDCIKKGGRRFFLMAGCEVPPAAPEENIRAFCPCDGCLIREELKC